MINTPVLRSPKIKLRKNDVQQGCLLSLAENLHSLTFSEDFCCKACSIEQKDPCFAVVYLSGTLSADGRTVH